MEGQPDWIADVLIGHGLSTLRVRQEVMLSAGNFILKALNLRRKTLTLAV